MWGALLRRDNPLEALILLEQHLPASAFVFFEYVEALDALTPCYRGGDIAIGAETRVPVGERLSGGVTATRTGAPNSDARLDMDPDLREGTSLRTALAVPVLCGQRCLGVLTFYSPDGALHGSAQAARRSGRVRRRADRVARRRSRLTCATGQSLPNVSCPGPAQACAEVDHAS